MANSNRASRLGSIFVACLATCGCAAYHPTIQPVTEQPVKPEDATYDCSQLEAAILRVDTVRWVIRNDGGSLESSGHQAARFAGNLFLILGGGYMNDGGNSVLNAADQKALERDITELLEEMNTGGAHSLVVPSEYLETVITKR